MKNYSYLLVAALPLISVIGAAAAVPSTSARTKITNGVVQEKSHVERIKKVPSRSIDKPESNVVATEANFTYTGDLDSGNGGFIVVLSSAGLDKSNPTHTGQMARFYIVGASPVNKDNPEVPTGTFTAVSDFDYEIGDYLSYSSDFLDVFPNPDDPEGPLVCYSWTPSTGTVTITKNDNDTYTVSADVNGIMYTGEEEETENPPTDKCTASFTGEIPYVDYYAYDPVLEDKDIKITGVSGRFEVYEGIGIYSIAFYNVPLDQDGFIIGAGDLLNLECYVEETPKMEIEKICGTYTPIDALEEGMKKGYFMKGIWYKIFGDLWGAFGTALSVYNDDGSSLTGLATDGTVIISKAAVEGEYTVVFDLMTPENKKITGSWTGPLADYVVDFTDSSVDDVVDDTDFTVRAIDGTIEAPADAEVYTLSGMRTGRTDLPAGVYVVRLGMNTKKVVMR